MINYWIIYIDWYQSESQPVQCIIRLKYDECTCENKIKEINIYKIKLVTLTVLYGSEGILHYQWYITANFDNLT